MPVVGIRLVTTAMFRKTWVASRVVMPHHQQGAEAVARVQRQPVAAQHQQGEEQHDQRGPDKAQLLRRRRQR